MKVTRLFITFCLGLLFLVSFRVSAVSAETSSEIAQKVYEPVILPETDLIAIVNFLKAAHLASSTEQQINQYLEPVNTVSQRTDSLLHTDLPPPTAL